MTDDELQVGDHPYFVQRLKIDANADERAIKRAYARELKLIDQEANPAGFQELREAYEAALFWLRHVPMQSDEDVVDPFDEIGRAAQAVPLQPAVAGAPTSAVREAPPAADLEVEADNVAQAVFAEFQVRCAVLADVHESTSWEGALQASLADPRLIHIAARQGFEQLIANLLAEGWRPGHHVLLVAATKAFEWENDRRRVQALGMAGYTLHFAIEQRAMYDLQSDDACEQQRHVIMRLRDPTPPSTKELIDAMPVLAIVEAHFPAWLALIADANNIARWHDLDQSVPSWRRRLRLGNFNVPIWTFVVVLLVLMRMMYSYSNSYSGTSRDAPTPLTIAAQHLVLGHGFFDNDDMGKAVVSYGNALSADPDNAAAYAGRAMALVALSEKTRALADLEKLASLEPRHPILFRARGFMAQKEGRHQDAIVAYSRSLEIDPKNVWTLTHRGYDYKAIGKMDNALNDADRVLEIAPGWPWAHLLRARVFMDRKDTASAKAEAAAVLRPANKPAEAAYSIAALIHTEIDDRPGAVAIMDKAVVAFPLASTYLKRAIAHPLADVAARRADIETALKLEPESTWGLYLLVKLELEAKQWKSLTEAANRALEHKPLKGDKQFLLTSRAIGYAKQADMGKANEDFELARLEATTAVDLNNLCFQMAVQNVALQTALTNCQASLAYEPNASHTLDSMAFTLLRLKRYPDALAAYDTAVKAKGDSADSLYGRGVVKHRVGDRTGGQADIKAALAIEPGVGAQFERMDLMP